MFLHHLVRWPSADIQVKFYGDSPRGTPPSGQLNTRGVAEYSDSPPSLRPAINDAPVIAVAGPCTRGTPSSISWMFLSVDIQFKLAVTVHRCSAMFLSTLWTTASLRLMLPVVKSPSAHRATTPSHQVRSSSTVGRFLLQARLSFVQ